MCGDTGSKSIQTRNKLVPTSGMLPTLLAAWNYLPSSSVFLWSYCPGLLSHSRLQSPFTPSMLHNYGGHLLSWVSYCWSLFSSSRLQFYFSGESLVFEVDLLTYSLHGANYLAVLHIVTESSRSCDRFRSIICLYNLSTSIHFIWWREPISSCMINNKLLWSC